MYGEPSLAQLYFIHNDQNSSLEEWKLYARQALTSIKSYIRQVIDEDKVDAGLTNLSAAYAAFSVVFVLASEEFDAALQAIIERNVNCFLEFLPAGTEIDAAKKEIFILFNGLRQNFETLNRKHGSIPVRETTVYEMKSYLTWLGAVTDPVAKKALIKFPTRKELRSPQFLSSLHLSIDPLTPPELAAKAVERYLRQYHEELSKEWEESWKGEVDAGIVDAEFAARDALHEQLRYDYRRVFRGNKKLKNGRTTFEIWLRRLEVYQLNHKGYSPKEIAERLAPLHTYMQYDSVSVCQDLKEAKALVSAALQNIPLAAVESTR